MSEVNFEGLKNNFDSICKTVNDNKEPVTLHLKNNRKVYILPEEQYNDMQKFSITISPQIFRK